MIYIYYCHFKNKLHFLKVKVIILNFITIIITYGNHISHSRVSLMGCLQIECT